MPAEIDALTEKIMKEYEEGEKPERRKRILLTGCPSSGAPMKVVKAIEENGGNVVVKKILGIMRETGYSFPKLLSQIPEFFVKHKTVSFFLRSRRYLQSFPK